MGGEPLATAVGSFDCAADRFVLGSAITSVAGVLGEMDPLAALAVVVVTELTVRWRSRPWSAIADQLLSMIRIGFLYGLFLEAFKLI